MEGLLSMGPTLSILNGSIIITELGLMQILLNLKLIYCGKEKYVLSFNGNLF